MRSFPIRIWVRSPENKWFEVEPQPERITDLNENGHDIYWVYNSMVSEFGVRAKSALKEINAFTLEVDGKKSDIRKVIRKHLPPSMIIETMNGYHLYWILSEPITDRDGDWYREFIKARMLPVFDSDPNAVDVVRLLRAPGFRYWKNGADGSFFITCPVSGGPEYTLSDIETAFPQLVEKREYKVYGPSTLIEDQLPADEWLRRLSGHSAVRGERYTFYRHSKGMQILVNGKSTACWVDKYGKIGAGSKGGPTILQWLTWPGDKDKSGYGLTKEQARALLEGLYNAV